MSSKIKQLFNAILSEDMAKQARQVEFVTLIVFLILLGVCWWLWQFQINLTVPTEEGREVVARMNIFELLLSKR
ncbi:MAG: hypothetical protein KJ732_07665 [Candidatus Margulisbacteria bacterium]|nr:hypothetical protein [Candidatus Margulisiibacteriota bacterium]